MLAFAQSARAQELPAAETAVAPTPSAYFGYVVRETAGAAAAAVLYDSADASGKIVGEISLAANAAGTAWFGPNGVRLFTGLFFHVVAGTIEGSVFVT